MEKPEAQHKLFTLCGPHKMKTRHCERSEAIFGYEQIASAQKRASQ